MLTRSRGDFEEILANCRPGRRADRRHRARARLRAAGDAGRQARRLGQQAAARLPRRGAVERARASTASSCASRAPWPASCRSSACCRSRSPARTSSASTGSSTAPRTSSSPRWRAAGRPTAPRSQRAQELGYAEADPTDDVTGRDAAAKMAILARLAFSTPVHLDQVTYEGIEHITRRGRRLRARPRPRAEADRHRRARRRRHLRPRAPGVPVSRPPAGVASTAPSTPSRSSPTRSPRSRSPARAPAARRPRAPCSAT